MTKRKKALIGAGGLAVILGLATVALPGRVVDVPEDYFPAIGVMIDPPDEAPTIAFYGDSYSNGSGVSPGRLAPLLGYAPRTASDLNMRAEYFAQGGTGYIADGSVNDENFAPMPDRVTDVVAARPDVVVVASGLNDASFDAADVERAARETVCALSEDLPDAAVFVVGPWDAVPEDTTEADVLRVRDILANVAAECEGQFLDPIEEQWVSDSGLSDDGIHPNIHGHAEIAKRLVAHVGAASR